MVKKLDVMKKQVNVIKYSEMQAFLIIHNSLSELWCICDLLFWGWLLLEGQWLGRTKYLGLKSSRKNELIHEGVIKLFDFCILRVNTKNTGQPPLIPCHSGYTADFSCLKIALSICFDFIQQFYNVGQRLCTKSNLQISASEISSTVFLQVVCPCTKLKWYWYNQ